MRRGHRVVHRQPGTVDAGGEGGQAEVGAHAVVGQGFHQREGDARHHGRPCQRQRHRQQASAQSGAEQARGLHHLHRPLGQRGAGQQIDIRIQAQHEQQHRAAEAAHVGPQRAAPAETFAQRHLQQTGGLQRVRGGVGQHIGRHRHRQQQRPLEHTPAGEAEQRHGDRRGHPQHRGAGGHAKGQRQRLPGVAAEHGVPLVAQHGQGLRVEGQPGAEHSCHGQRQQQGVQAQQRAHRRLRPGRLAVRPAGWERMRTILIWLS